MYFAPNIIDVTAQYYLAAAQDTVNLLHPHHRM